MQTFFEISFWTALSMLAWTYAGYALFALFRYGLSRKRVEKRTVTPSVTIVLVAREWDPDIEARITSALSLDYPEDCLEVLVVPAGSLGRLPSVVAKIREPRLRLLERAGTGLASARSGAASHAKNEILVFPDECSLLHPDALRKLVRNFADPLVGAVCGNRIHLRSRGEDSTLGGERLYADWDKWLKGLESRSGSIACAERALWAVRRELHGPSVSGTNPDFSASTNVVRRGYRLIWEPAAVSWERGGSAEHRFRRRMRTARGNLRALLSSPDLLNPFAHGTWSLVLFSHIVLRWLSPVAALVLLASSLPLLHLGWVYALVPTAFVGTVLLAGVGAALRESRIGRTPALSLPLFVCLGSGAALVAVITAFTGRHSFAPASDELTANP